MPITARTQVDVTRTGATATGSLITGLTSTDLAGFTPSISRPIIDQASREPSLNTADVTFPALPATTGTAYTSQGKRQNLVLLPTQFQGTGVVNGQTRGTERRFSQLQAKVFYSAPGAATTNGATFRLVDGKVVGGALKVDVDVVDSGAPVVQVLVLYLDGGTWKQLSLAPTGPGHYAATSAALSGGNVEFFVQAVTNDGVVRATTNKAANFGTAPAPRISISSPVNGATYTIGHPVTAAYSCTDATTGKATPLCDGTVANGEAIATATPGKKTFTVTATDANGATRTESRTYSVGYAFTGFFAPVQNEPYRNASNAGQAIPFKWQLRDAAGGYFAGLSSTDVSLVFSRVACSPSQPIIPLDTPVLLLSGLTYDPVTNQYQLVVKTPKSFANTCQQAQITFFGDPSSKQTATFEFK